MKKLIISLLALATPAMAAQVYKCVGADGKITFSNNPYCQQAQAYAKTRNEPLLTANPGTLAKIPTTETIELYYDRVDLADVLEIIGDVAGIAIEPVALEGTFISIKQPPQSWLEVFNNLVVSHNLDYRQSYGKLYVYQLGGMGETIVHTSDLLRWYQDAETWDIVLKNDGILLAMKAFEGSQLRERLPNLLRRVREELGEQAHTNAAETVVVKESNSSGVSSSIAASQSQQGIRGQELAAEAAKRLRIVEKRQSNGQQRQLNSQSRCFSSNGAGC